MKCQSKILSVFIILLFTFSTVYASLTDRTIKKIKFRKWFSKKLFDQAKGKFDHARKKVDQAQNMILLAQTLIHVDKNEALDKGEKINNESTFEQLVISKFGQIKDISNFGQFLLGFLVGDLLPKYNKGLPKENALRLITCLKDNFQNRMKETKEESQKFFHKLALTHTDLEKEVVKGFLSFNNNISNLAKNEDVSKLLASEIHLGKFLNAARNTTVVIIKYVNENLKEYRKCIETILKKNERKDAWGKIIGVEIDFAKKNECEIGSKNMLLMIMNQKRSVQLIKNLWEIYMKNGLIQKKLDKINWYKTGLAAGGIRSTVIKPLCLTSMKNKTMKAWNSRYFRK